MLHRHRIRPIRRGRPSSSLGGQSRGRLGFESLEHRGMLAALVGSLPEVPDPQGEPGIDACVIEPPAALELLDGEAGMPPDAAVEWPDPTADGGRPEVLIDWPQLVDDWPSGLEDVAFAGPEEQVPEIDRCDGMPKPIFFAGEAEVTVFTVADELWFDAEWEFPGDENGDGFAVSDELLFTTQYVQRGLSAGVDEAGGPDIPARPQAARWSGDFAMVASWLNVANVEAEVGKLPGGRRRGR